MKLTLHLWRENCKKVSVEKQRGEFPRGVGQEVLHSQSGPGGEGQVDVQMQGQRTWLLGFYSLSPSEVGNGAT